MIRAKDIANLKYVCSSTDKIKKWIFLEIIIAVIFIFACFGHCEEYSINGNDFNKSYDDALTYFDDGSVGIAAQGLEEVEIMNYPLNLRSGAYEVKVVYTSVSREDITSFDNCAGRIVLTTDNARVLRASEIQLRDGQNESQSRFWLRYGSHENEVKFCVRYYGNGKLAIKNIRIEEKRSYRVLRCFFVIMIIAVFNLFYVYFIKKDDSQLSEKTRFIITGIAGITLMSSITYFTDFLFVNWGHDLYFHMSRIMSLANGLKEFQIPHRMQFEMLNGYGYANPLFYGEIFLLLPAILYNFYLPVQTCYQIFVISINFVTCVLSYWCFVKISHDYKKGLFGAFVYTLASYRLMDIMVRAAVGEYTALMFFPLLIYGFWSIYNKKEDEKISLESCMPIILAATGIVNSHILSCEMLLIVIIPFVIINYRKTFRKNILVALIKSVVVTFLLNAWYVVPFLQSMGMKVNVAGSEHINKIEISNVYIPQLFGIFHTATGINVGGTKEEMPLAVGISLILGIVVATFIFIKKDQWKLTRKEISAFVYCLCFGLLAFILSSSLCKWDNLIYISEKIAWFAGMVQIPWRYLGIATALLTAMLVFGLQIIEKHTDCHKCNKIMLIIMASTVLTEGHFVMEYINKQDEINIYSEFDIDTMQIGAAEYLLRGTDLEQCKQRNVLCGNNIDNADISYIGNGKYDLTCSNLGSEDSYVDVPVLFYDNYHAYKSDNTELDLELGENNRIRVDIPGNFQGNICLKYKPPVLWRICEIISFVTMCGIVIGMVYRKNDKN